MPTPQTLRERLEIELPTRFGCGPKSGVVDCPVESLLDFILPRFSTILEEVIGEDEEHSKFCNLVCFNEEFCSCGADAKNALRKHQRIIGKEYLK